MTLKEYMKGGSSRSSIGSVVLTEQEVGLYGFSWLHVTPMLELRAVTVNAFKTTYVQKSTSNTLWTMDDHGNPKRPSVFSFPHNHKHNLDQS